MGTQDLKKTCRRYEASYRRQHPYTAHAVDRDGFTLLAREFVPAAGGSSGPSIILMHGFPDSLHLGSDPLGAPPGSEPHFTLESNPSRKGVRPRG